MPTSPGLITSNNWGWAETLKNSFTLVELGPLHKNRLSSLSVIRVTTHSKGEWQHTQNVSDNTLKIIRWVITHSRNVSDITLKKGEHYSSK
jgi:hypothetical protein